VIAELGQHALAGTDLSALMDEAVCSSPKPGGRVLQGFGTASLRRRFALRAGVGWREGLVDTRRWVLYKFTRWLYLLSNKPVLEDLHTETRFSILLSFTTTE